MRVSIGNKEVRGWKRYPIALGIILSVWLMFFVLGLIVSSPVWLIIYFLNW